MFAVQQRGLAWNIVFVFILHCALREAAKSKGGKKASFKARWDVVGPFIRGNFEHDGDPIEFYGGIKNVSRGGQKRFLSEVATGGYVGWSVATMQSDGLVQIGYDSSLVDFQFLQMSLKDEAATNTQSWAVGDLGIPQDGVYLIRCSGVHTIEIGSRLLRGTNSGEHGFPIELAHGTHVVYVKVSGQGPRLSFSCSVKSRAASLILIAPPFAPHIHDGDILGTPFIAPEVINIGKTWIRMQELEFGIDRLRSHANIEAEVEIEKEQPHLPEVLAPGLMLQMPLKLRIAVQTLAGKQFPDADCVHFYLTLRFGTKEIPSTKVTLKCRQRPQSFLFTFLDFDGSVSHAAAIKPRCGKPWKPCRPAPFPIALTLSGVSVGPLSQADSYKVGEKGSNGFLFGFKEAWTLAPEREGPHNWEDWGYLNVLRSIEALAAATNGTAHPVNPDRLFIAGHSRGGHGAWSVAERIPDRTLGVSPASGWTYRQYGDVSWNKVFAHDIQNSYLDLQLKAILERCLIEGDTTLVVSNLAGLPMLVRQGGKDRTVAPFLNRRMARSASEAGAKVEISEIRDGEHWWWNTKDTNDGGVVNDATMRAFSAKCLKTLKLPPLPKHFRVTVINPSSFSGRAGIRILQTEVPFRRAFIDVSKNESEDGTQIWELRSVNVRRFALSPRRQGAKVSIDGSELRQDELAGHFCRSDVVPRQWVACLDPTDYERRERGPQTWGPARQVVLSPFAVVAYTDGDAAAWAEAVWDISRYVSHGHLMAVHSHAMVLRPEDVTLELRQRLNLIHIGGPAALLQALPSAARARWPVQIEQVGCTDTSDTCPASERGAQDVAAVFTIGPCKFQGARHGLVFTAPRWEERAGSGGGAFIDLVVTGTDVAGILDVATFHHKHLSRSPFANMVPDFFLSGPEYKAKGFGGLLAAGFWGSQWEWRADVAYMEC